LRDDLVAVLARLEGCSDDWSNSLLRPDLQIAVVKDGLSDSSDSLLDRDLTTVLITGVEGGLSDCSNSLLRRDLAAVVIAEVEGCPSDWSNTFSLFLCGSTIVDGFRSFHRA
jgi:hypothetical protein